MKNINAPLIPVSIGELFDKITILKIKLEYILDINKIKNIQFEYNKLTSLNDYINTKDFVEVEYDKLFNINHKIWFLEDSIRAHERLNDFGSDFITIARDIHASNDLRSAIKKMINLKTNSSIIEEKSY